MKVTALAGGVGGAKLMIGLQAALSPGELTAIVNTGDDATLYGVHVSPDVDIVTYWLAGIADRARGWGILDDRFAVVDGLAEMGEDAWFRLGDRDFATCIYRTQRMREGATLSAVTDDIRKALGVPTAVMPMSDDEVRTHIVSGGTTFEFQEWFVRERQKPPVDSVELRGIENAKPSPGMLDAIAEADVVVLCPSNPIVSIAPILAVADVRRSIASHPNVVAVTPIVGGAPLKGPADVLLASAGVDVSASGVAGLYSDICRTFVVDVRDPDEAPRIEGLGMQALSLDSVMTDPAGSKRLAEEILGR